MVLIPYKVVNRKDLRNLSKMVFGCLYYSYINEKTFLTINEIGKYFNVSRQSISNCIRELKEKELISVFKNGMFNAYAFKLKNEYVNLSIHDKSEDIIDVKEGFTQDKGIDVNLSIHDKSEDIIDVKEGFTQDEKLNSFLEEFNLSSIYKQMLFNKFTYEQITKIIDFVNFRLETESFDVKSFLNACVMTNTYDDSF